MPEHTDEERRKAEDQKNLDDMKAFGNLNKFDQIQDAIRRSLTPFNNAVRPPENAFPNRKKHREQQER